MKKFTEQERWYLKGYADALQRIMYELTGDNTCSKSYDPISFGDGYIASYAFDLVDLAGYVEILNRIKESESEGEVSL